MISRNFGLIRHNQEEQKESSFVCLPENCHHAVPLSRMKLCKRIEGQIDEMIS